MDHVIELMEEMMTTLTETAQSEVVVGEEIALGKATVVPLSRVSIGFGGGGGGDAPAVSDIASQTIEEGETFSTISLDDFVTDPDHADSEISWSFSGNSDLTVSIDGSRIASVTHDYEIVEV